MLGSSHAPVQPDIEQEPAAEHTGIDVGPFCPESHGPHLYEKLLGVPKMYKVLRDMHDVLSIEPSSRITLD